MHELSIARNLITIVKETIHDRPCRVKAVTLRIGRLSNVLIDSLEFGFSALTAGTELEGARLIVRQPDPLLICGACGRETILNEIEFACPHCGSMNITVEGGDDLFVESIEVEEDAL